MCIFIFWYIKNQAILVNITFKNTFIQFVHISEFKDVQSKVLLSEAGYPFLDIPIDKCYKSPFALKSTGIAKGNPLIIYWYMREFRPSHRFDI